MADGPIPIRDGVLPETDFERELLDYCATKIRSFRDDYGTPPTRIALVLSGDKGDRKFTDACSWDVEERYSRLETCSVASAILLKRAIDL